MNVIGTGVIDKTIKKHGDLAGSLGAWLKISKGATWKSLDDLRKTLRDTDTVNGKTAFNIKGNAYRLIAVVNYDNQTVIVKDVLTHAEYTKGNWKK